MHVQWAKRRKNMICGEKTLPSAVLPETNHLQTPQSQMSIPHTISLGHGSRPKSMPMLPWLWDLMWSLRGYCFQISVTGSLFFLAIQSDYEAGRFSLKGNGVRHVGGTNAFIGEFTKPQQRTGNENGRITNRIIMSTTMAVHVRNNSWYNSLPSCARQQREMTKYCVVWRMWTTTVNF